MKKVVVTCITNDYDTLKTPLTPSDEYEYICFTDAPEKLQSDLWKIKPLPEKCDFIDRKIKMLTHKYVDYDLCLWVDASVHIIGDIIEFEELLENYGFLIKQHPGRDNLGEEFRECLIQQKGNPEIIVRQQNAYAAGFLNYPVYEMGIHLKVNCESINKIMELWWEEFSNYPARDQLSFPIALAMSKNQSDVVAYEGKMFVPYFRVGFHMNHKPFYKDVSKRTKTWWDFTPFCTKKEVGVRINEFCEMVPDNDWIIIRDPDALYPDPYYGQLIEKVITEHPDIDLFGAMTNRLGLLYQLPYPKMGNNTDMTYHTTMAEMLRLKHSSDIQELHTHIAGFFLMFNKQVWKKIKFIDTITDKSGYLDYHFSSEVLRRGGKVALIKGLYLYHNYRVLFGENAPYMTDHIK